MTTADKLKCLIDVGVIREDGGYVIIGEKRYKTYRNRFSKILENKLSSLYIKSHMPSVPSVPSAQPRNIKDKILSAVRHHGAKI